MNFAQYTIKAQENIQSAQQIAFNFQNPILENLHLLYSILEDKENVVDFILKKNNINKLLLIQKIEEELKRLPKLAQEAPVKDISKELNTVLLKAPNLAKEFGDDYANSEHLLLAILSVKDNASICLQSAGLYEDILKKTIKKLRESTGHVNSKTASTQVDSLNKYAKNLNEFARKGKLDPVIGRDEEIRRVLHILSRRTKNNPILVGEPGVGKTAIAEGIAHRIVNGDVPDNLLSKTIYSLDMGLLIAGAKYKGEFEDRLKGVVQEVTNSDGEIILFIDEIHTLVGAGASEGAMDAANILKPALARGELRAVGATTLNEYQKYFEKDKALERRFQVVAVDEPSIDDAISILRGLKDRYETHHHVRIKDEAIIVAVELSARYISDRQLPDKAIDLIDESAAKLRMEMNSMPQEMDELERKIRQLEIEREAIKRENDTVKLSALNDEISTLSIQRDEFKTKWLQEKSLVDGIQNGKSKIESLRIAAEQAEREGDFGKVAEIRYGKIKEEEQKIIILEDQLIMVSDHKRLLKEEVDAEDIAESVAKATGIPIARMLQSEKIKLLQLEEHLHKRVIGQDEAIIAISDAIRRSRAGLGDPKKPIGSFIFLGTTGVGKTELAKALADFLFDDESMMTRIDMSEYQEKHAVSRLVGAPPGYVGYEEGGQLTEAVRRKPYSVVLFDEIEKAHQDVWNVLLQVLDDGRLTDNKGRVVNFKNTIIIMTSNLGSQIIHHNFENVNEANIQQLYDSTKVEVLEELRQTIRPEFLNRIDEIIMFHPLLKSDLNKIVKIQLKEVEQRLEHQNIKIEFTEYALDFLANSSYDPQFGARPLKRIIQKDLLNLLSKKILIGEITPNSNIKIDVFDDQIVIIKLD